MSILGQDNIENIGALNLLLSQKLKKKSSSEFLSSCSLRNF